MRIKATRNKVVISAIVVVLSISTDFAQTAVSDSIRRQTAIHAAIRLYDQTIQENSRLYNGHEFIDPFVRSQLDGHPYFVTDEWQSGNIHYDGQYYESVTLKYDLFQDIVLVEHPTSHREIELISEKIQSFGIAEHFFVRLQSPSEGFYDQIYTGDLKIYSKRYKLTQDNLTTKTKTIEFLPKEKLYILKKDTYYQVSSKSSVLKVLVERKSELKKLLDEENISFKRNKEFALQRMGSYYDQLNQEK
ncbi:MAG: hypothetical protein JNL53_14100 [Cyclobacteriaceae bacterium]|nr:hypothetical protein [Cyclobacteriaceae bacterium]